MDVFSYSAVLLQLLLSDYTMCVRDLLAKNALTLACISVNQDMQPLNG